jgi:putative tricarboxylic transport membrane protein
MPVRLADAATGVLCILVALAAGVVAWSFPAIPGQEYGAATFPVLIASGLGICGALLLGRAALRLGPDAADLQMPASTLWKGAAIVGLGFFYVFAATPIGFVPVMAVLLLAALLLYGTRLVVAVPVAIISTLLVHFVFYKLLRVPLPWGVLQPWAW